MSAQHPGARLVALDDNEGFAAAVVRGTDLAKGKWSPSSTTTPSSSRTCWRCLAAGESDPTVGIVTAQVRFADDPSTINTAGLEIDNLAISYDRLAGCSLEAASGDEPVEVFGASGCVAIYRLSMLRAMEDLDASFFAYMEDADVAWRARMAGWRCLYEPRAVAFHHGPRRSANRHAGNMSWLAVTAWVDRQERHLGSIASLGGP